MLVLVLSVFVPPRRTKHLEHQRPFSSGGDLPPSAAVPPGGLQRGGPSQRGAHRSPSVRAVDRRRGSRNKPTTGRPTD